ncbi:DUF1510 family protein [Bacillus sp. NTK071]|uniref:YrrS family protein n=1 Tax=Bacillus sp. NTK071 TaxID=2802175 RepID=UPI001A8F1FFF|nr:DUF1510 family protein [Bacillus sp. NTK071]
MRSRYGDRHSKRKQNIILNSLIGLVLAVILVLVANIFFFGDAPEQTAGQEQQTAQSDTNEETNSSEDAVTSDEADSKDSASNDSEAADKDSANEESTDEDKKEDQDKEKAEQEPGEPNLDGPWDPVGTSQPKSEKHVSSYDKGSVDWNEKLRAVESVTGFPPEEMVVHWLGGNGGPQKSKATVSQKGANDTKYYVELEWVDEEGWKAVSATKQ